MLSHPAHAIALGFGAGLAPVAPGTVGTLLAFPIAWVLETHLGAPWHTGAIVALFMVGVWACDRTGSALGISDHSSMVWDEVVAMLLILMIAPHGLWWWLAAFILFRVFDVLKPPPIRQLDQKVKGGLGVMVDDLAAAFYALIVLAITARVMQ